MADTRTEGAWTITGSADLGDFHAARSDGVTVIGTGHGDYPCTVLRPLKKTRKEYGRTIYNEHLPGKATSARRFKTIAGAIKAADKSWPLKATS